MMVKIEAGKLSGRIAAPPSKSYAHRAIICAALAGGKISGISESEDILATIDCISQMGAKTEKHGNVLTVSKIEGNGKKELVLPCRESGSTLRFLVPLAMTLSKKSVFTGSPRLIERGIGVYDDIFTNKGVKITKTTDTITVSGKLSPALYKIPGNISSQFITGLLFALPLLDGNSSIEIIPPLESKPYIDITLDIMKRFGINIIKNSETGFTVPKNQKYRSCDTVIEGDWSNSAFFLALNELGNDIEITGLCKDSVQGDKVIVDLIRELDGSDPLIDISACPDLAPVLFALAAIKGGAEFTGTRRLKIKESNRAEAMKQELEKFGIDVSVSDNSVKIARGTLKAPKEAINSHNDHRIVMAATLLLTKTGGMIEGAEAISKSYPDFFEVLSSLGSEVTVYA